MAKRRRNSPRDFPRTARVNELVREILGDELERIDDPRLEMVSISEVEINQELTQAAVYFSSLRDDGDKEITEALGELRVRLQAAIGRQARMRRTPELRFVADPSIRTGWQVEQILRDLDLPEDAEPDDADADLGDAAADADPDDAGT